VTDEEVIAKAHAQHVEIPKLDSIILQGFLPILLCDFWQKQLKQRAIRTIKIKTAPVRLGIRLSFAITNNHKETDPLGSIGEDLLAICREIMGFDQAPKWYIGLAYYGYPRENGRSLRDALVRFPL
jgi:hypothetical protein